MRTIAIVSERRADYSRFKPILELIREDPELDYRLIVTGISLLKEHGNDIDVIKQDGFNIEAVMPMFREDAPDTGADPVGGEVASGDAATGSAPGVQGEHSDQGPIRLVPS